MDGGNNQSSNWYNMIAFQNKMRKLQTMQMQYSPKASQPQPLPQTNIPKPPLINSELPK